MRTTRRAALMTALAGGVAGCATEPSAAAVAATPTYNLPFTDVQRFTSAINGVDYSLYVRTPARYAESEERYPVIVTLDADYSFALCANHLEHLADRNQAPHTILVSIAYTGAYPDRRQYSMERSRDYTPIFIAEGGYGPEFQAHSGGGPAFLRVIEEEVLTRIDAAYRTEPGSRTLVGHSYGGLFAGFALHTRPDLFDRYLMVSPSLWYADQWMFAREAEQAATRLPRKTRVYLGVGSWEQSGHDMVGDLTRFAAMLEARGDANLVVKSRVFEDETHASIFPAAFSTGVRHLFQTMN